MFIIKKKSEFEFESPLHGLNTPKKAELKDHPDIFGFVKSLCNCIVTGRLFDYKIILNPTHTLHFHITTLRSCLQYYNYSYIVPAVFL